MITQPNSSPSILIQTAKEVGLDAPGYVLTASMTVDLPIQPVFEFFSDAMQLESITPPWLHFSVLTPQPIEMRKGLLLDYKLYLHRIPIKWRTEIAEWDPPYRFVDTQLKGPYKRWYHTHTFEEHNGQTLVKDHVHYIPRGGSLIHRFFVKPDLLKIFGYRQEQLAKLFAAKKREIDSLQSSRVLQQTS
ncbi:MAG: SRPBCC family protein [Planctomycetota bacterium]